MIIRLSRHWLRSIIVGAFALVCSSVASAADYPDQGSAYAACKTNMQEHLRREPQYPMIAGSCSTIEVASSTRSSYYCKNSRGSPCMGTQAYYFLTANNCSTHAPLGSGVVGGTGAFDGKSTCDNGCKFSGGNNQGLTLQMGGKTWALTDGMTPTGATCTSGEVGVPDPVVDDDCVPQGTLTQCVKPDGRVCTKASTGKMFCYGTSESGSKSSGNEATVISPDGVEAKPPTTPPANGGEWVKAGEGSITTTKDGVTTTKTVTTYVSNYGTEGKNNGAEGDKDGDKDAPTASTGEGCSAASFQCSDMSSVECNQLIQTFYLRCRGKQINGGANCDAPPTCEGNSTDCFIGQQLWNYRCEGKQATEGDGSALSSFDAQVNSEGDGTDEPDAAHMPTANGNTADMGIWEEKIIGGAEDLAKLDASGFLGGSGSCPQLPTVNVGGVGLTFNLNPICELLRNVGVMVMALAYWLAYRIIAKSSK